MEEQLKQEIEQLKQEIEQRLAEHGAAFDRTLTAAFGTGDAVEAFAELRAAEDRLKAAFEAYERAEPEAAA